jgi:hypothetical protein
MKTKTKTKLPTIKSLESKVWELCKQITRLRYEHRCVSCGEYIEGKYLHTGHYFRKKYIPLRFKYDLRILRPQCPYCNTKNHGTLEWYTWYLLKEGVDIVQIGNEILMEKQTTRSTPEERDFLLELIQKYQIILDKLKQT